MRGLAILVAGLLLATALPATALAAKPTPTITSVVVSVIGLSNNYCQLNFDLPFDGRAYGAIITEMPSGSTSNPSADNKLGNANIGWGISTVALASEANYWTVVLIDRKGKPLSTVVTTTSETVSICPEYGTEIARYTP